MTDRTCIVDGCHSTGKIVRGLCHTHYERQRRTGSLADPPPPIRTCTLDGCEEPHRARGWCMRHYNLWRSRGSTDEPPARPVVCTADDCDEPVLARGLCPKHYQRSRNRPDGDLSDPVELTPEQRREGQLAAQRRHREKNRDRLNEARKAYRQKNLERERERNRQWHRDHPGVNTANTRAWRLLNLERVAEANRRWYAENKAWSAASSAKRRALERATRTEFVDYDAIVAEFGMVCHICTEAIESRAGLHMDHVIPLARGGTHTYGNLRPSHRRCNQSKGAKLLSEIGGLSDAPEPGPPVRGDAEPGGLPGQPAA